MNAKKIKILIATGIYPPSIGGPASYSKLLMEKLPEKGFDVSLITFDSVRKYGKGLSHLLFFLMVILKGFRCDIVYVQDPVSVGLPVFFATKIIRRKYILKVVGDFAWEQGVSRFGVKDSLDDFVKTKQNNIYVRFLQKIEKIVANNAKEIIVPSKYLKGIVQSWGVSGEKITVIYNAFKKPEFEKEKSNKKDFVIVSVGRLVPWKGFDKLIDVVNSLSSEIKNIKLNIIGSGPLYNDLKKREDDNIKVLGVMSQLELYKEISNSDLFVLNTGYEGFSHQLLEVMSIGVPIITTKVGGNTELISNNQSGILVEYNNVTEIRDSILKIYSDKDFADKISKEGLRVVSQFSEEKMLSNLSVVFEKNI